MILLQSELPFIRPGFSFDVDDIIALVVALTALIALFVTRRTKSKTVAVTEQVDAPVLEQFKELLDRITKLELELAEAKVTIEEARREIREMRKLEEFLQAKLHEKEQEIERLKSLHASEMQDLCDKLDAARERIQHLEDVCQRAGLNSFN